MEDFQRLLGVVAATLNKPATEVAEAAKSEEGVAALTESFKTYRKEQYDSGHKAAKKESTTVVEAALRKRGAPNATFAELDEALDALETSARDKAGKALTPEELLRQKPVVDALNAKDREREVAVQTAKTEAEQQVAKDRLAFQKEQATAKVEDAARKAIKALDPNLHSDPAKAERQLNRLIADIKAGEYEVDEKGNIRPVDAKGEYLKNDHGHPVAFDEHVRGIVTAEFDLPAATQRDSPGLTPEQIAAGQNAVVFKEYKGAAPKTEEEYIQLANDPTLTTPALQELQAHWKTKQAA